MGSHKTSSQETMVSFITVFSVLVLSPTLFAVIPFGGYSRAIPQRSVLETLIGDDQFSTLVAAVKIAFEDPAAVLASVAPLTLFAPTNDVFAAVPEDTLNGLLADPEALRTVLLRHIVANNVVGLPRQMARVQKEGTSLWTGLCLHQQAQPPSPNSIFWLLMESFMPLTVSSNIDNNCVQFQIQRIMNKHVL